MTPLSEDGSAKQDASTPDKKGLDLWLKDADTMNDPWEGSYLIDRSKASHSRDSNPARAKLNELFEKSDKRNENGIAFDLEPIFICSFSVSIDDLDLWRHYCSGHGVCLKFSPPVRRPFYKVEYGEDAANKVLDELAWAVGPILKKESPALNYEARSIVRPICYLFKSEAHASDKEFRLIESDQKWKDIRMTSFASDGKEVNRLYILVKNFFYSSDSEHDTVIVGPLAETLDVERGHQAYAKEVKYRLSRFGLGHIPVRGSRYQLRY
jgi:hypothetical protein